MGGELQRARDQRQCAARRVLVVLGSRDTPAATLRPEAECVNVSVTVDVAVDGVKVAATVWFALIATLHAPVPLHAPPHPTNAVPAAGVAVSASVVEAPKLAEQVPGHAIPVPLTVPRHFPPLTPSRCDRPLTESLECRTFSELRTRRCRHRPHPRRSGCPRSQPAGDRRADRCSARTNCPHRSPGSQAATPSSESGRRCPAAARATGLAVIGEPKACQCRRMADRSPWR
jgi:hypothetical protein